MRVITHLALAAAVLAASLAVAPVASADGWRDRGYRDGPRWSQGDRHRGWDRGWDRRGDRGWDRGRVRHYHHHHRDGGRDNDWDTGSLALGALLGLGAGVVLGTTVLAPPAGR